MTAIAAQNGSKPIPLTHTQGLALFDQVIAALTERGWERLRIDTLVFPDDDPDQKNRWTVRHRYDHGTWWLYFEPDAYWARGQAPHPDARVARIDLDKTGQTAPAILSELFGPELRHYAA